MRAVKFGIIGCGLMGREFASAASRWCHLTDMDVRPEIVAICDRNENAFGWYDQIGTIQLRTPDYHELLALPEVEAVYVAVPHNLHAPIYCDVIAAGKHLMGEKPFGIDLAANESILASIATHPDVFVRCSSEIPFHPVAQRICGMIESGAFGRIIAVNSGFLHSSDMDPEKPINWKRMVESNGEYGVLGDLGLHACHIPFRAGWLPRNVRAILLDVVKERPDGKGERVPCKTWDNGTMFCEAADPLTGEIFPLTLRTERIHPGATNLWSLEILGTKRSARFSTANPRRFEMLEYHPGSEQAWQQIDMGYESTFPSITGKIFEFGFADQILQMWAAFLYELEHGHPLSKFAGCVRPDEVHQTHRLFTAALESHRDGRVVRLAE